MGLIFTLVSLFVLFPITGLISGVMTEDYENYDHELIKEKGTETQATVRSITVQDNHSINGRHPLIIRYDYKAGGIYLIDSFRTMDFDKVEDLQTGDELTIVHYLGQSIIKDIEPFVFSFWVFYIGPFIFLAVGLVNINIALIPAIRKLKLYRYGTLQNAAIVSIAPISPGFLIGTAQKIMVHYEYLDSDGKPAPGSSTSRNYLWMLEKKSGDVVKIFVSPSRNTVSCLVPELEAKRNNWQL